VPYELYGPYEHFGLYELLALSELAGLSELFRHKELLCSKSSLSFSTFCQKNFHESISDLKIEEKMFRNKNQNLESKKQIIILELKKKSLKLLKQKKKFFFQSNFQSLLGFVFQFHLEPQADFFGCCKNVKTDVIFGSEKISK
jgi:hypothetical protein